MIAKSGKEIWLEVDGGIDTHTAAAVVKAGAQILVAGLAIFGAPDVGAACRELRRQAEQAK
jgi:ribulose-phosphate 3-epimerase